MSEFYKVLVNGHSCHGGNLQWSLPVLQMDGTYKPGHWHNVKGDLELCVNGLHVTDEPHIWSDWIQWDADVYEVETRGELIHAEDGDKSVARSCRLLKPAALPSWWVKTKKLVAGLATVPYFQPDGNPDPSWKLFIADTWDAAGNAAGNVVQNTTWSAAGNVARSAAGNVARSAAWNAAWSAARSAAWNAARIAARDAAGVAARDAAGVAARDAAIYITLMGVCSDLFIHQSHQNHIAARWNAWEKGYAVLCDVDDVLYVYAKEGKSNGLNHRFGR